jgi:hypothetical protein
MTYHDSFYFFKFGPQELFSIFLVFTWYFYNYRQIWFFRLDFKILKKVFFTLYVLLEKFNYIYICWQMIKNNFDIDLDVFCWFWLLILISEWVILFRHELNIFSAGFLNQNIFCNIHALIPYNIICNMDK